MTVLARDAAAALAGSAAATPVRVVLVDDTPSLRMLTRLLLDGTGFEVIGEAGDGLAGVNLVKQLQPDLVLLDLAMPVMDGLEALPLMRAAVPTLRVVIISGFDRRAMESQVLDAGADGYLQKGTPPDVLIEHLHRLFPAMPDMRDEAADAPADTGLVERLAGLEDAMEQLLDVVSHDRSEPGHVIEGFADRMQTLLDDLLEGVRSADGIDQRHASG
jgi:DNA-binding NarL/FixJ family response regulator